MPETKTSELPRRAYRKRALTAAETVAREAVLLARAEHLLIRRRNWNRKMRAGKMRLNGPRMPWPEPSEVVPSVGSSLNPRVWNRFVSPYEGLGARRMKAPASDEMYADNRRFFQAGKK